MTLVSILLHKLYKMKYNSSLICPFLSKQIMRLTMEAFVRDSESKAEKRCPVFFYVNVCLVMSHPMPKPNFHFCGVWHGFKMYKDIQ